MSREFTPAGVETAFWLLLCGGLATGIGLETDWGQRWQYPLPAGDAAAAAFTKPALAQDFSLPAADSFLETAMRPIFVSTRRPSPPGQSPEASKTMMKRDQFTLSGITVTPEGKFAFLIEKAGNKSRVVSEGKEINGIKVKEITADRVVLSQHDETEVLLLRTTKAQPVVSPGTNVPAPAMPGMPGMPPGVPGSPFMPMIPAIPDATNPAGFNPAIPVPQPQPTGPRPVRQIPPGVPRPNPEEATQ